jgi:hypothetical protein
LHQATHAHPAPIAAITSVISTGVSLFAPTNSLGTEVQATIELTRAKALLDTFFAFAQGAEYR